MNRRKKERQEQAIERQEKYDNLSVDEKLNLMSGRRGNSEKELKRVERRWFEYANREENK